MTSPVKPPGQLWSYFMHTFVSRSHIQMTSPVKPPGQLWSYFMHTFVSRSHIQMTSPVKPPDQLSSYFIFNFLGLGERKYIQMILVFLPGWPPCICIFGSYDYPGSSGEGYRTIRPPLFQSSLKHTTIVVVDTFRLIITMIYCFFGKL